MLLKAENTKATLVIALSGAIAAMVANGPGPLALGRVAARVMSNPTSRGTTDGRGKASVPGRRIAVDIGPVYASEVGEAPDVAAHGTRASTSASVSS